MEDGLLAMRLTYLFKLWGPVAPDESPELEYYVSSMETTPDSQRRAHTRSPS